MPELCNLPDITRRRDPSLSVPNCEVTGYSESLQNLNVHLPPGPARVHQQRAAAAAARLRWQTDADAGGLSLSAAAASATTRQHHDRNMRIGVTQATRANPGRELPCQ
jgi:hypothetical protein